MKRLITLLSLIITLNSYSQTILDSLVFKRLNVDVNSMTNRYLQTFSIFPDLVLEQSWFQRSGFMVMGNDAALVEDRFDIRFVNFR